MPQLTGTCNSIIWMRGANLHTWFRMQMRSEFRILCRCRRLATKTDKFLSSPLPRNAKLKLIRADSSMIGGFSRLRRNLRFALLWYPNFTFRTVLDEAEVTFCAFQTKGSGDAHQTDARKEWQVLRFPCPVLVSHNAKDNPI